MKRYLGLDVHCKQTVYVCQEGGGRVLAQGQVETSEESLKELIERWKTRAGTVVGLETGSQATWVAQCLEHWGVEAWVIEAREVRAKARRWGQKCDRRDALEICDGLRRGIYTTRVWVPTARLEALRRLLSRRRHFVKVRTQQINAAKFVLRSRAMALKEKFSLKTPRAWDRLLAKVEDHEARRYVGLHAQVWKVANTHVTALEEQLHRDLEPYRPVMELLRTVPGVGLITAGSFVAMVGDPQRFSDSGQVVSYLGLAPATFDSGERQRHGHLTRRGCGFVRADLCEAAQQARRLSHPLHPYYAREAGRNGHKRAVIAVAQRLARILWRVWRDARPFDLDHLNVVAHRREVKKTLFYEIRKERDKTAKVA